MSNVTERTISVKEVTNGFILTLTETSSTPVPPSPPGSPVVAPGAQNPAPTRDAVATRSDPTIAVALNVRQIAKIAEDFYKDGTVPTREGAHPGHDLPDAPPPKPDQSLPGAQPEPGHDLPPAAGAPDQSPPAAPSQQKK